MHSDGLLNQAVFGQKKPGKHGSWYDIGNRSLSRGNVGMPPAAAPPCDEAELRRRHILASGIVLSFCILGVVLGNNQTGRVVLSGEALPSDWSSTLNVGTSILQGVISNFAKASPADLSSAGIPAYYQNITSDENGVEALRYFIWKQFTHSNQGSNLLNHEAMAIAADMWVSSLAG
jgi:hypothetical protein